MAAARETLIESVTGQGEGSRGESAVTPKAIRWRRLPKNAVMDIRRDLALLKRDELERLYAELRGLARKTNLSDEVLIDILIWEHWPRVAALRQRALTLRQHR